MKVCDCLPCIEGGTSKDHGFRYLKVGDRVICQTRGKNRNITITEYGYVKEIYYEKNGEDPWVGIYNSMQATAGEYKGLIALAVLYDLDWDDLRKSWVFIED